MVTLVWSSEALLRILCAVNVLKMWFYKCDVYVDQLLLWNLMMSFLFTYDPQKLKKIVFEKLRQKLA